MIGRHILRKRLGFSVYVFLFCVVFVCGHQQFSGQTWTKDFAVEVESDDVAVELAARAQGFKLVRKIPIGDLKVLHFHHPDACDKRHRCKRHAADLVETLKLLSGVTRVEQQYLLERDKRSFDDDWSPPLNDEAEENSWSLSEEEKDEIYRKSVVERHERIGFDFNDPLYRKQWHLDNFGQVTNPGLDLNLLPVWRKGYMGQNVNVLVIDDGVDTRHKDLQANYVPLLSADLDDPTDRTGNPASKGPHTPESQSHGTSCAGEIASAANNTICGVGVAPKSRLGGVRLLAGHVTDLLEAYAVLHQHKIMDVISNSWGPTDNGKKMEMPHYYTAKAIEVAATKGRNGLGTIITFASGNGGHHDDNCGADGYTNTPHTNPMGAVNEYGLSVFYGERCSAILAVTPVGGRTARDSKQYIVGREKSSHIITTGINQKCNTRFLGTSAATPLGAGCLVLVVQANPKLTWRDVQHVVSRSSRLPNDVETVWQRNGAGLHVSHHFGFGLMDCSKAVRIAQNWTNVGPRLKCQLPVFDRKQRIYANRQRRYYIQHDGKRGSGDCSTLNVVEHVTITVKLEHARRGDLELWLLSPWGTVSRLLGERSRDKSRKGIRFTFLTRLALGEKAHGTWIFEIRDTGRHRTHGKRGAVHHVSMTMYGTRNLPADLRGIKAKHAHKMTASEVRKTFVEERRAALDGFPEHRDVLELKREILEKKKLVGVEEKIKRMREDPFVTLEEVKSVMEVAKKIV